jgi:hypothetical protein
MGAVPGAQQPQAGAGFVLNIPADPTWEPIETTDTLEMDGYYSLRIKSEKARTDGDGVWITFEILDEDARGKNVSKSMPNSATKTKDTWWLWRSLFRSITGGLDMARSAFQYTPGVLLNQLAYARTGAYADSSGSMRTGVDAFVTKTEYDEAVAHKKHRWPAKVRSGAVGPGAVGALPGGLPSAFPGMGGPGLPGAPASPTAGMVPAPAAANPMQQAPQGFPAPAVAAPVAPPQAPAFTFAPPTASGLPAPAASFAFAPPPVMPVSPVPVTPGLPAPPANGAPQPVATTFPFPPAPGSR